MRVLLVYAHYVFLVQASFNVRELTYVLDGSKAFTNMKEMMANMIENDEVLNDAEKRYDLTLQEVRSF